MTPGGSKAYYDLGIARRVKTLHCQWQELLQLLWSRKELGSAVLNVSMMPYHRSLPAFGYSSVTEEPERGAWVHIQFTLHAAQSMCRAKGAFIVNFEANE